MGIKINQTELSISRCVIIKYIQLNSPDANMAKTRGAVKTNNLHVSFITKLSFNFDAFYQLQKYDQNLFEIKHMLIAKLTFGQKVVWNEK